VQQTSSNMLCGMASMTRRRFWRSVTRRMRVTACVLASIVAVLASSTAFGQTSITWSGTTSNAWATTTNWNGGIAPGATSGTTNTDIAVFNTNPTNKSPTWSTYLNLAGFTFDAGAGAYTIGTTSGSSAFLTSGGTTSILTGVTAAQTINAPLVILNASGSNAGSYTFLNSSTASAATLTLGGTISGQATTGNTTAVTFNSNQAGTISGVISDGTAGGAVSLAKLGAGTLTLSANNTYSGATTVNGAYAVWGDPNGSGVVTNNTWGNFGTLRVSGSLSNTSSISISGGGTFIDGDATAANNNGRTNRINSAATLTMGGTAGGGTFTMAAPAASNTHSQSLASLAIGPGYNLINASGTTGTTNLTFTGPAGSVYTRSTGGMVNFVPGTGVFTMAFTNTPSINMSGAGSNAILVGAFLSGTNFVGLNSGTLTAATYTANGASSLTAGANIDMGSSTSGLTGVTSINSLRFNNSGTTQQTVTLTSGTLVIASGGIITGTGAPRALATAISGISGGALTSGTNELFFSIQNSADNRTAFGINIASQIVDNAAGAVGLNISGNSSVLLSNTNNSFTGNIYMNSGVLALSGNTVTRTGVTDGVLGGTNTIYATNGINRIIADLNSNPWTDKHSISIAPGAMLDISSQGGPVTINASVTGSGVLGIGQSTYNQGTGIIIPVDQSGFTGTYAIGTFLRANEGVGLSSNANLLLAQNSVAGNGVLETSANMTRTLGSGPGQVRFGQVHGNSFGGGFSAVGTAGANPITVSLGGVGTPQTLTWGVGGFMNATNGGGNSSGLVLQDGNANNTLTWANPINNNGYTVAVLQNASTSGTATAATMTGAISGTGGFRKLGAGLLILSATNTYTGKTSISAGSLSVATIGSVSGTGNLGAPTTAANGTIDMGDAAAATLLYTGTGETTDRVVNLSGTTFGVTLDQSGSGLLKFTSGLTATGSGAKTLTLQGSTAGTGEIAGAIVNYTGAGGPLATGVTKAGTGTWTLSGVNTYTGVTTINGGVLSVSSLANGGSNSGIGASTNAAGNLVLGGGSLQYTGATVTTDRAFTLTASTTSTIDVSTAGSTLTFAGGVTVGATTGLTKDGAGTLVLAGNYVTNTPRITINSGTLQYGNGGAAGGGGIGTGGMSIASGAGFVYNRTDQQNFTTGVSGSGGVTILSGTLGLQTTAATYSGPTTISGGVLFALNTNIFSANSQIVLNTGTVNLNFLSQTVGGVSGSAGTLITTGSGTPVLTSSFASGTLDFAGTIADGAAGTIGFTKSGAGTQVLSGANTYTGITTINGGVLSVSSLANGGSNSGIGASTNAAGNLVLGGGSLQYTGGTVTTDRSFSLTASTTSTIDVSAAGSTLTFSGSTAGTSGALTKAGAGTLAITGSLANTGATTVSAGTLQIGNGGATGNLGTGNVSIASGATLVFNRSDAHTFANTTSGSGSLTVLSGSLTLSKANTYTGPTTVSNAVLRGGIANAFGSSAPLSVNSGTVNLGGFSQSVGALSGSAGTLITTSTAAGSATLTTNFASGTSTFAGSIANNVSGTIAFTKSGAGTQVLSGNNTYTGATTVSAGQLSITGTNDFTGGITVNTTGNLVVSGNGRLNGPSTAGFTVASTTGTATATFQDSAVLINGTSQNVGVGSSANSRGIVIIKDSANLSWGGASNLYIGGGVTGMGTVLQSGGGVSTPSVLVAANGGAKGYYSLSGGSLTTTTRVRIADPQAGAVGVFQQSGGSNTGSIIEVVVQAGGSAGQPDANLGYGTYYMTGGTAAQTGNLSLGTRGGQGDFTLNGGSVNVASAVVGSLASNGTGILNLNGGVFQAGSIQTAANTGKSYLTFAGGTLRASGNSATFVTGLSLATIQGGYTSGGITYAGGATIDTNTRSVTIGQSLLAPTGNGVAVDVFSPITGLLGAPYVLVVGSGSGATAQALYDPDTGTMTGITVTSPGVGYTDTPTFQIFGGGLSGTTTVNATTFATTSGGLTKTGSGTLTLSNTNTYSGDTRVNLGSLAITNASALLNSTLDLNALDSGTVSFSQDSTLGGLTGSRSLDLGTRTLSIGNNGQSTTYSGILSNGALTKIGAGTLALSGTNTFSGATSIAAGILSINGTSALAGTSGLTIAGGAGLTYTGGAATFGKNVTVTAGSGTGTIRNSGGGLLTLSGNLSKDNSVLRLTGGAFNVTGVITGATPGASDLFVDDAFVTLSNTNTYNGPTYVFNSGTLELGVNNAIPDTSVVTLGDDTSVGTLVMGTYTDSISQLVFSGSGGTVSLSGDKTASAQLATAGSLTLGSNASLVLTAPGSSAGLYRLISATSISGSFASVTGASAAYQVITSATSVDYQQRAVLGGVSVTNPVASIITGGSASFTYSVANSALSGGASLAFTGTGVSNVIGSSSGSALGGGSSGSVGGLVFTGTSVGAGQTGVFTVNAPDAYGSLSTTGTVSVNVLNHSLASFQSNDASALTLDLGTYDSSASIWTSGSGSLGFALWNIASGGFANADTAGLAYYDIVFASGSDVFTTNLSNFGNLAAGTSNSYLGSVLLPGSLAQGNYQGIYTLKFRDQQNLSGATDTRNLTLTMNVIVVPEPAAVALAGIGIGLAGWLARRRRK
jgi:fibronectin-binding autotransporter adhesin